MGQKTAVLVKTLVTEGKRRAPVLSQLLEGTPGARAESWAGPRVVGCLNADQNAQISAVHRPLQDHDIAIHHLSNTHRDIDSGRDPQRSEKGEGGEECGESDGGHSLSTRLRAPPV
jgi:hypothetical protein